MAYVYLFIAIITEVIGTMALKESAEFTKIIPSIVVLIGYSLSFYFMTLSLRVIPLGITYAIWSGLGIVILAVIGAVYYHEKLDIPAIIGMGVIVIGVIIINLFSKMTPH